MRVVVGAPISIPVSVIFTSALGAHQLDPGIGDAQLVESIRALLDDRRRSNREGRTAEHGQPFRGAMVS